MGLLLEVEAGGWSRTVELDLTPAEGGVSLDLSEEETLQVVAICGENLAKLAAGEWNREAADAILYVKLFGDLEDKPPLDAVEIDWSQVGLEGLSADQMAALDAASEEE